MQQDEETFIAKDNREMVDKFTNFIGAIIAALISLIPLYFAIN